MLYNSTKNICLNNTEDKKEIDLLSSLSDEELDILGKSIMLYVDTNNGENKNYVR
jgi:hypothetical protein